MLLALIFDAGAAAWNGYEYSHTHSPLNLIWAAILVACALYLLVVAAQ